MTTKVEAKATLLGMIKPGDTVYYVLRHATDHARYFDFYLLSIGPKRVYDKEHGWHDGDDAPTIRKITREVCNLFGWGWDRRRECFKTTGYAPDTIYHLSYQLWGEEGKLETREI